MININVNACRVLLIFSLVRLGFEREMCKQKEMRDTYNNYRMNKTFHRNVEQILGLCSKC